MVDPVGRYCICTEMTTRKSNELPPWSADNLTFTIDVASAVPDPVALCNIRGTLSESSAPTCRFLAGSVKVYLRLKTNACLSVSSRTE